MTYPVGWENITKAVASVYNQLQAVDVSVPREIDEFRDTDYEKCNHSLCQYMDSIELAMHR